MQVIDRLPRVFAAVDYHAIASLDEAQLSGHIADGQQEVAHQSSVLIDQGFDRCDRLLGDQKHMDGCLRVDVVKGQAAIVFVDDLGWNFVIDDSLKDRFFSHNGFL